MSLKTTALAGLAITFGLSGVAFAQDLLGELGEQGLSVSVDLGAETTGLFEQEAVGLETAVATLNSEGTSVGSTGQLKIDGKDGTETDTLVRINNSATSALNSAIANQMVIGLMDRPGSGLTTGGDGRGVVGGNLPILDQLAYGASRAEATMYLPDLSQAAGAVFSNTATSAANSLQLIGDASTIGPVNTSGNR